MATYKQKLDEQRLKSLRIIEAGLSHPDPSQTYMNAILFLGMQSYVDLNTEVPDEPDALDASEISDDKEKK